MSVSGLGGAVNVYVPKPVVKGPKQPQQTPSPTPSSASTPAATVNLSNVGAPAASSQAQITQTAGKATGGASTAAAAPKVNAVKLANKEANEPLQLLTKQAKHGDVVAKLLLKQITAKQAAKQAEQGKPEEAGEAEEGSETEGASEKPEATKAGESSESSGSAESAAVAEPGKGELVDQHA